MRRTPASPYNTRETQLELPHGQLLSFSASEPLRLRCRFGVLWLTVDGKDVILHVGDDFDIPPDATVVLEAMQDRAGLALFAARKASVRESLRLDVRIRPFSIAL